MMRLTMHSHALVCLLLSMASAMPAIAEISLDVVTRDQALYSTVPFGSPPPNGVFYLNNTFGKGHLVNGVDYSMKMTARKSTFPNDSIVEWSWPKETSGSGFAYAYPEMIYGGTPWGNPYKTKGPWPQRIDSISELRVGYEIVLGGNVDSYNILLDMYVTASPDSIDGSHVAELSFFPHLKDPEGMTEIQELTSVGRVSVRRVERQIMIRPVTAQNGPRDLLNATVNLKEIIDHLIAAGFLTGKEYLRGIEFGAEVQVPNAYNSTPHVGSLKINKLAFSWK